VSSTYLKSAAPVVKNDPVALLNAYRVSPAPVVKNDPVALLNAYRTSAAPVVKNDPVAASPINKTPELLTVGRTTNVFTPEIV
jgi:hypothetical protein